MAEATQQLSFIIDAENKAEAAFKEVEAGIGKVEGKLEKLKPAFQKMAAVGTVAFAAISAVAIKTLKDFGEAQAAQKQLEHAVIDVSHATREQLKATEDLAVALEKKGVLDGDNIKIGLAQLSTFGLSNKAVQGLGGALADLAVNQFGVSASGEQLSQTANMIAKALNGQFGVLEKSGIRFTEAQQKAIKFGTEMEKVKAINEGFAQNLKYTNDVAITTLEGGMAKLNVQMGNISEGIGAALAPALSKLLEKAAPVIEKIVKWIEENPKLTTTILAVGAGVAALVGGLGFLGLALPFIIGGVSALGTAFMFLAANPIGLTIVAIAALVAAGIALYKNWDKVKAWLKDTWDGIKLIFRTNIDAIMAKLQPLIDAWNKVKSIGNSVGDKVKSVFTNDTGLQTTIPRAPDLGNLKSSGPGGTQFNFNFNGDVSDIDTLEKRIIGTINRGATLKAVGGQ